jgi:hypothetical protein
MGCCAKMALRYLRGTAPGTAQRCLEYRIYSNRQEMCNARGVMHPSALCSSMRRTRNLTGQLHCHRPDGTPDPVYVPEKAREARGASGRWSQPGTVRGTSPVTWLGWQAASTLSGPADPGPRARMNNKKFSAAASSIISHPCCLNSITFVRPALTVTDIVLIAQ